MGARTTAARRWTVGLVLGALVGTSVLASGVTASPTLERERVNVASFPSGILRLEIRLAYNPDRDEFLAVYGQGIGNDWTVFSRRLDKSGRPIGPQTTVSTPTTPSGTTGLRGGRPDVAYNPVAGEYLIAWEQAVGTSNTNPPGRSEAIFVRRTTGTGSPIGAQQEISARLGTNYFCSHTDPRVAFNEATGGYLVVGRYGWRTTTGTPVVNCGEGLAPSQSHLRSWNLSAQLSGAGPGQILTPPISTINGHIAVAENPVTGEFMMTWSRPNFPTGAPDVSATMARRISSAGAPIGDPIEVATPTGIQAGRAGTVAADPVSGNYLIAAASNRPDGPTGLVAHVFSGSGARIGGPTQLSTSFDDGWSSSATGDGGWVVGDLGGRIVQVGAQGGAVGEPLQAGTDAVGVAVGSDPSLVVALLRTQPPPTLDSVLVRLSSGFESLVPGRLWDSRSPGATVDGVGLPGVPVAADSFVRVPVAGRAGVPVDAGAVSLNVTIVGASGPGFATVWPCGATRPDASNLNYVEGQTVPNSVLTQVGSDGEVCVYSSAEAGLLVDVNGAF